MRIKTLTILSATLVFLFALPVVMAQTGMTTANRVDARMSSQMPPVSALIQDPGPIGAATTTAIFAHVAVGGDWNTVFTFLNTGTTPITGNLILTANDGTPMNVSVSVPSAITGSTFPISIPAGGIQILTANPISSSAPTSTGWARVESSGGQIGGVGTFQYFSAGGSLITTAGVLSADPVNVATIPVDDDNSQSRYVGYALANTGTTPITIKVDVVDNTGTVQKTFNINLNPGAQLAKFLFQDDPTFSTFSGSMVLVGQNSATFAVVALVQDGSLYTVIPVIPSKAANIN